MWHHLVQLTDEHDPDRVVEWLCIEPTTRPGAMEISNFIIKHREFALSLGDYRSYQSQLSRKLRNLRKRLGQATPKGKQYTPKPAVTVENLDHDARYRLVLSSV